MKEQNSDTISITTLFRQYNAEYISEGIQNTYKLKDIFICEACLSFFLTYKELEDHIEACFYRYWIPGDEIYRCQKKRYVVFEIDGRKSVSISYTRRIAQIAKLFLEEKTTLDDLHFFAFVVIFEIDDFGYHFAGYFSKEWKRSIKCDSSLSCVMILPPYRSKGYGALLIEISYEMGKIEGSPGTPERPLSKAGKKIFERMWKEELIRAMSSLNKKGFPLTINSLSVESGMTIEDVTVALQNLNLVFFVTKNNPLLLLPRDITREANAKKRLNTESLIWTSLF